MALAKKRRDDSFDKAAERFNKKVKIDDLENIESTIGTISVINKETIERSGTAESKIEFSIDNKEYLDLSISDLAAAPPEWNLWSKVEGLKKLELVESVMTLHLLHNIVVWEVPKTVVPYYNEEKTYMILSGHNRVEALRKAHYLTDEDKFLKAHALVYKSDSISEAFAKRIIDDANSTARDKTTTEISSAFYRRLNVLKSRDEYAGVSESQLMKILGTEEDMARNTVHEYIAINSIIPEFKPYIDSKVINKKAAVKLASLDKMKQEFIRDNIEKNEERKKFFCNKYLLKLKPLMTTETIDRLFNNHETEIVASYKIRPELKVELDKFVKELKEANENIF